MRGDSGFCRQGLIRWCERAGVSYVIGWRATTGSRIASRWYRWRCARPGERSGGEAARDRRAPTRPTPGDAEPARGHAPGVWRARRQPALLW
ncbi:MAG: hypothetical protein U1E86_09330 [Burkholderiaceae bacterium]